MRISLTLLGCKVNQAEMAEMERRLLQHGHEIVGLDGSPEICIVNTCTVTSKSDYQSRQLIRKAAKTGARVIATGCYTQMNMEAVASMEGVSDAVPNTNKETIIQLVSNNNLESGLSVEHGLRSRYMLKVQDGCNNSCSYCIVWKARGKSRSISIQEATHLAAAAVECGYNEIVLTGIHLGTYGADIGTDLHELLRSLLSDTTIKRIRLSSLEVTEIDNRLVDLISFNPRISRHLHIPLQSGDNDVLKSMKRHYDARKFSERILEISSALGDIGLGTDAIAGYPSETLEAHENTLNILRQLPFTYLHVFPYSNRKNTASASIQDQVGHKERRRRAEELRCLGLQMKADYLSSQTGRRLTFLAESLSDNGRWTGTTDNYLKAELTSTPSKIRRGSLMDVEVSGVMRGTLVAKPIKSS